MNEKTNGVLNVTITEPADRGVLTGRAAGGQSVYLPLDRFRVARAGRDGVEYVKPVCGGYEKMLPVGETVVAVPQVGYREGDRFVRAETFTFANQYQMAMEGLRNGKGGNGKLYI